MTNHYVPGRDGLYWKTDRPSRTGWLSFIKRRARKKKLVFSKANMKLERITNVFEQAKLGDKLAQQVVARLRKLGILKLKKSWIYQFNLPAGITCPGAKQCKRWVSPWTGETMSGPDSEWECYAIRSERRYPEVLPARWNNLIVLKNAISAERMAEIIEECLPRNARVIRIHESGDFWNRRYLEAWIMVAERNPGIVFFGYSKTQWAADAHLPENMFLHYSDGGRYDDVYSGKIPTCYVGINQEHILQIGEPVVCADKLDDWQDFAKILLGESFTIPLH